MVWSLIFIPYELFTILGCNPSEQANLISIADGHKICSSHDYINFKPESLYVNLIKLLNYQAFLVYDRDRIKWTQDLHRSPLIEGIS